MSDTKAVKLFAAFVVVVFYLIFCGITFGASTAITVDKNGNVERTNKPVDGVVKFGSDQLKVNGVSVVGGSGGGGGISSVPVGREFRVDGVNGDDTAAAAAAGGTDTAVPFLTIGAAITAAGTPSSSAPKTIRIGPGTFALGNAKLTLPNYLSLVGSGRDITIITSSIATTGGAIIVPGNNSTISDLTIQGVASSEFFQVELGTLDGEQDSTGVVVKNVHIIGNTDGIYIQDTSALSWSLYDCLIETAWDSLIVSSPATVEASNCNIISTGSSSNATTGPQAIVAGAIIRWNGGRVKVSGSTSSNHAFIGKSNGRVDVIDGISDASGVGAVDIESSGPAFPTLGVFIGSLSRPDGGVLVIKNSTGTTIPPKYLTRGAQRDNNLSDLADAATSRTNLGAAADSATVHNTGAETIAGAKEFTSTTTVTLAPGLDTIVSGSLLRNTSTATVDHVQDSPADDLEGRVFATGGFGSKPVKIRTYAEPVQSGTGSVVRLFGSAVGASATFHYGAALFHQGGLTLGETDVTNLIDPGDGGLHMGSATVSTLAGFDTSKNLVSINSFHAGIPVTGGYPITLAENVITLRDFYGNIMFDGEDTDTRLSARFLRLWFSGVDGDAGNYGQFDASLLTATRSYQIPDADGTILLAEQTIPVTGTAASGKVPVASDATHAAWGYINGSTAKVYRALLTQSGTSNPSVTVLENSLGGTVAWTFSSTGTYIGTLSSAFPVNKTFLKHGDPVAVADEAILHFTRTSASVVTVVTRSVSSGTWSVQNAMLSNTEVEIFVYP